MINNDFQKHDTCHNQNHPKLPQVGSPYRLTYVSLG